MGVSLNDGAPNPAIKTIIVTATNNMTAFSSLGYEALLRTINI
jgi:hypothetical protein